MLEKGKISNNQFSILVIMYIIGTSTLTAPAILTMVAKQDGWLSSLLTLGFGLTIVFLFGKLAERYPNLTLTQTCTKILGGWLGRAISLLYSLFFLFLTSVFLRVAGDLITTHILTETPIQATVALFLFVIIMAVRLGLEPFARTAEMMFPHLVLFILLFFLFLLPQVKGTNITPMLEHGIKPVLHGTFETLGIPFLNLIIFLMITPYVNNPNKLKVNFIFSTIIGGLFITFITLFSILVNGAEVTARLNFSPYILAQKIDIGNFIQRIEIIAGAFIFISLFVKTTICFYSLVLSFAETLRLKDYKIVTLPFGIMVQVLSIFLFPNIIYFHTFVAETWTPIMLIFGFIIPLLLLAVDLIKPKFAKRNIEGAGRLNDSG